MVLPGYERDHSPPPSFSRPHRNHLTQAFGRISPVNTHLPPPSQQDRLRQDEESIRAARETPPLLPPNHHTRNFFQSQLINGHGVAVNAPPYFYYQERPGIPEHLRRQPTINPEQAMREFFGSSTHVNVPMSGISAASNQVRNAVHQAAEIIRSVEESSTRQPDITREFIGAPAPPGETGMRITEVRPGDSSEEERVRIRARVEEAIAFSASLGAIDWLMGHGGMTITSHPLASDVSVPDSPQLTENYDLPAEYDNPPLTEPDITPPQPST